MVVQPFWVRIVNESLFGKPTPQLSPHKVYPVLLVDSHVSAGAIILYLIIPDDRNRLCWVKSNDVEFAGLRPPESEHSVR